MKISLFSNTNPQKNFINTRNNTKTRYDLSIIIWESQIIIPSHAPKKNSEYYNIQGADICKPFGDQIGNKNEAKINQNFHSHRPSIFFIYVIQEIHKYQKPQIFEGE